MISTSKRPVPLRHYVYTGNSKQTSNELFEIVSKQEIDKQRCGSTCWDVIYWICYVGNSYSNALRALKDREKKSASQFGPKSRHYVNPKQVLDFCTWIQVWLSKNHGENPSMHAQNFQFKIQNPTRSVHMCRFPS